MQKRELFGGALRSAGLMAVVTTSVAHAGIVPHEPDFTGYLPGNYTLAAARDANETQILFSYDYNDAAAFTPPTSYSGTGGSILAYANASRMGVQIAIGEPGFWTYAVGTVLQSFTVDEPTVVLVEWDFTYAAPDWAWVFLSHAYPLGLTIDPGSSDVFRNNFLAVSGTGAMEFTLYPAIVYTFSGRANTWYFSGMGDVWLRMTVVPAPSALALFGIGVIVGRRRRRE